MLSLMDDATKALEAARVTWGSAAATKGDGTKGNEVKGDDADGEGATGGNAKTEDAAGAAAGNGKAVAATSSASAAAWKAAVEKQAAAEADRAVGGSCGLLLELESRLREMQTSADVSRVQQDDDDDSDAAEIFQCDHCDFEGACVFHGLPAALARPLHALSAGIAMRFRGRFTALSRILHSSSATLAMRVQS